MGKKRTKQRTQARVGVGDGLGVLRLFFLMPRASQGPLDPHTASLDAVLCERSPERVRDHIAKRLRDQMVMARIPAATRPRHVMITRVSDEADVSGWIPGCRLLVEAMVVAKLIQSSAPSDASIEYRHEQIIVPGAEARTEIWVDDLPF